MGLRHTVAVILRECGYDKRTIADALGQKTIEMARLYAHGADLTRKMSDVAKKSRGKQAPNKSVKSVNPDGSADGQSSKHESIQQGARGVQLPG